MKITLLRPPYVMSLKAIYGQRGVPPLNLAYLSAALKKDGHTVTCIDAFAENMDHFERIPQSNFFINGIPSREIIKLIPEECELLAISCMFSCEWIYHSKVIKSIKAARPNLQIVLGGEHTTADFEYILKHYSEVDFCILGEGEEKIRSLAKHLEAGNDKSQIPGIAFFDHKTQAIIQTANIGRIKDLSTISVPDWSGIPLDRYLERKIGMSYQDRRSIPMLLSRGCPYACTFCSNEKMWDKKWLSREISSVISEIKKYKYEYDIDHIDFLDLTAIVNREWTIEFCKKLLEEDLKISWSLPSGTRSEALDDEVLRLLGQSGCSKITYAPETGSHRMNKEIQKKVNLSRMIHSMHAAVENDMVVKANIIIGFPQEGYLDIMKTMLFILRMALIGIHDVPCFGFSPYPGSLLFDQLLEEKKIKRDQNYYEFLADLGYTDLFERKSFNKKLPGFSVSILCFIGMSMFYSTQFMIRPWRFLSLIKNLKNKTPQTMLEIAFYNIIQDFIVGKRIRSDLTANLST